LQLLQRQLRQGGGVRLGFAEMVIGTHDFTHVEPFCGDIALTQNFHKQQGGHQFAVADQFIG
jgi:hypothetical protein